jgi:SOS-response transcriptional repressor LexA
MKKLTTKQQQLLSFIIKYQNEQNKIPSLQEMADHLGNISTAGISHKLSALARKKILVRETMYKILAVTVPSAPIAKVEENMQQGVGMERPLP